MALAPAFAAARRAAAARLLLTAGLTAVQQSIDISWPPDHSSKPAAVACGAADGTNGQRDGRTHDSSIDPALHTMRAAPIASVK